MEEPEGPESATDSTLVEIVVCEKHGLRYNVLTELGCVRCLNEVEDRRSRKSKPAAAKPKAVAERSRVPVIVGAVVAVGGLALAFLLVTGGGQLTSGGAGTVMGAGTTDVAVIREILADRRLLTEIERDLFLARALDEGDTNALGPFLQDYRVRVAAEQRERERVERLAAAEAAAAEAADEGSDK